MYFESLGGKKKVLGQVCAENSRQEWLDTAPLNDTHASQHDFSCFESAAVAMAQKEICQVYQVCLYVTEDMQQRASLGWVPKKKKKVIYIHTFFYTFVYYLLFLYRLDFKIDLQIKKKVNCLSTALCDVLKPLAGSNPQVYYCICPVRVQDILSVYPAQVAS